MTALLMVAATAAGVGLLGASASGQSQPGTELKANPYDVIFDNVVVGDSATKTVTLTNKGTTDLSVTGMVKYGPHPGDFSIADDACTGKTVAASASCTFNVVFTPTKRGTRVAHLRVDGSADCSTYLTLAGSGPNDETPSVRTTRAGCTAPAATASPTPSASPTASPTASPGGGVAGFQQSGTNSVCPGRSKVRINFHTNVRTRLKLSTATATVGGRTFKIKRNMRRLGKVRGYYYSILDFKGLTAPRYKVKVRGTLTNGKKFARNRIFKNCITSA